MIQARVKCGCFCPKAIDLLSEKKYNYDELIIVAKLNEEIGETDIMEHMENTENKENKKKKKLILIIIFAVIALIAAILLIVCVFSQPSENKEESVTTTTAATVTADSGNTTTETTAGEPVLTTSATAESIADTTTTEQTSASSTEAATTVTEPIKMTTAATTAAPVATTTTTTTTTSAATTTTKKETKVYHTEWGTRPHEFEEEFRYTSDVKGIFTYTIHFDRYYNAWYTIEDKETDGFGMPIYIPDNYDISAFDLYYFGDGRWSGHLHYWEEYGETKS